MGIITKPLKDYQNGVRRGQAVVKEIVCEYLNSDRSADDLSDLINTLRLHNNGEIYIAKDNGIGYKSYKNYKHEKEQ